MVQIKHKPLNQTGFASIVIALILILVLALMTVGFAQLARREQQNALNKQLSIQAYNAAESGINDARQAIKAGTITDQPPRPTPNVDTQNCLGSPWQNVTIGPSSHGVAYSCLVVNLQPLQLTKDLSANSGWVTTFSLSGAPQTLTINWSSQDGQTMSRNTGGFTPDGSWRSPAVLQFSITPLSAMDRASLINNTFNAYLYPWSSSGLFVYDTANQGPVANARCTASGGCTISLSGLPNSSSGYFMHVVDYYDHSLINVSAQGATGPLKFINSQVVVDATGKAHNVLKRLRVTYPLNSSFGLPNYALEGDACKRFQTDPSGSQPSSLPYYRGTACNLNN